MEGVNISGLPSVQRLIMGVLAIRDEDDDPEDTLRVALTRENMAAIVTGLILVNAIFPEMVEATERALQKFTELANFQGFYPTPPEGFSPYW